MKRKRKKKNRKKQEKKKFIWGSLLVLFILGIVTALLAFLGSRLRKETPESQPEDRIRTPLPEIPANHSRREKKMKKFMKYAAGGLYFLLILGICSAPLFLLWVKTAEAATENRTMASLPQVQTQEGFNWDFLSETGAYFTDHFAFRQEMVSVNAGIRAELFGVSPVEDVIVGKNGWLYYAATLDDYQHKDSVSERMLFNMAHNTALMQEYTEGLGKSFVFTIAPNKNSLYDENMPERLQFQVAAKSDAQRLLPWLIQENVNYVNLFDLFEEQEEILYYARDSHWNDKGAVMVYNALLDACGKSHETYEAAQPVQQIDYYGDLGVMLFPVGGNPESRFQYPIGDTWYYAEGEKVEDSFIRTENENGEGNLLMYRDSFGNSLLPYMAQTFSQTIFSKQIPYPMRDLETYEPDIVIVEKVERQLPTLGKVPPLMNAPLRKTEKVCVSVESMASVEMSEEGNCWKLEGMADPVYMDPDSHIYVEVEDDAGAELYEAFCVSSSDQNGGTNDYGYLLYIPTACVVGDMMKIRVMTEQEEAMVVLLQEEIPVPQKPEDTAGEPEHEDNTAERDSTAEMQGRQDTTAGEQEQQDGTAGIQDGTVETRGKQGSTAGEQERQDSTAGTQDSTVETRGKQGSTAGEQEQQDSTAGTQKQQNSSTAEMQKKQNNTAGTQEKQNNTAETQKKQNNTAGTQGKQKNTAETQKKQDNTAGVQEKQNSGTAEAQKKQDSTAGKQESSAGKQTEPQTRKAAGTQAGTQTAAEPQTVTKPQAEAQSADSGQEQSGITEVSRMYVEDCGTDSGYWAITYSDGHVEYLDD